MVANVKMDKNQSKKGNKRERKELEDEKWDCSVCTFANSPADFKCYMCDIRKGTSTRKPRINSLLVAQVAHQFNPTPPKTHKKEKSEKKNISRLSPKKKHHLRKLRNIDRSTAETQEVTVNNITVTITEYKAIADRKSSDQSGQSSRASSESDSCSEGPSADSDSRSSLIKLKVS